LVNLIKDNIIKKTPNTVTEKYNIFFLDNATGVIYVTKNSPQFISGQIRMRGRKNGQYPFGYKEMLEEIFGRCSSSGEQIEVCSGWIGGIPNLMTVDINPERHPVYIGDGQSLPPDWNNRFDRWHSDPPYNERNAKKMYGTQLPSWSKLLTEGARITKPGGLLFLLLGNVNMQWHPKGTTRIGWLVLSIIPNQEARAIHIYLKNADAITERSVQKETQYHIRTLNSYF
jgi:ribosomal protein L31